MLFFFVTNIQNVMLRLFFFGNFFGTLTCVFLLIFGSETQNYTVEQAMPYFMYFCFWVRLVSWDKITLIQTFFYVEFFTSNIRRRQNLNRQIRLKLSNLFESSIFICFVKIVNTDSEKTDLLMKMDLNSLNFFCGDIQHVEN